MRLKSIALSAGALATMLLPFAAPVLADESTHTTTRKTLDVACIQTAVGKREDAILAAFDKRSTAVHTALVQRKTDLAAAWAMTNRTDRNKAVRMAWKTYQTSWKSAQMTFRTERQAAWKTFNTDRKACGATGDTADMGTMGLDNQL